MKVIFLDIDGVLNDENFDWKYLEFIQKHPDKDMLRVDEEKVEILSEICHEVDAKVVISSSWKLSLSYGKMSWQLSELLKLFKKYDIDCIGFTPNVPNSKTYQDMWKEYDISKYLEEHNDVGAFCIIDDDLRDLSSYSCYVVRTNWKSNGNNSGGLQIEDKERVKKLLKEKVR